MEWETVLKLVIFLLRHLLGLFIMETNTKKKATQKYLAWYQNNPTTWNFHTLIEHVHSLWHHIWRQNNWEWPIIHQLLIPGNYNSHEEKLDVKNSSEDINQTGARDGIMSEITMELIHVHYDNYSTMCRVNLSIWKMTLIFVHITMLCFKFTLC